MVTLILAFLAGGTVVVLYRKHIIEAAFCEGQRAALKKAINIAKDRGDVATTLAPSGHLREGLTRAQMAHAIEMDLRRELTEVQK